MHEHSSTGGKAAGSKQRIKAHLLEQLRQFLVMFLYLWVLLGLFVLNDRVVLGKHGIPLAVHGVALLNALVLAKVMLLAQDLHLTGRFDRQPLAVSIVAESLLLTVLFIIFHLVEHTVAGLIGGESLRASIPTIGSGGIPSLISIALILFVSLIPFQGFQHLSRVLGPERTRKLLFHAPQPKS